MNWPHLPAPEQLVQFKLDWCQRKYHNQWNPSTRSFAAAAAYPTVDSAPTLFHPVKSSSGSSSLSENHPWSNPLYIVHYCPNTRCLILRHPPCDAASVKYIFIGDRRSEWSQKYACQSSSAEVDSNDISIRSYGFVDSDSTTSPLLPAGSIQFIQEMESRLYVCIWLLWLLWVLKDTISNNLWLVVEAIIANMCPMAIMYYCHNDSYTLLRDVNRFNIR